MASIPMDQPAGKSGGGKPSISAHPAFPAIVALWFAALLGLGSLIVPAQLLESIISATGISSIVSAAAPPLGFTARAVIALTATGCGAALGFFAARKIISKNGSSKAHHREDSGLRALNPIEDLDDDGLDEDLPPLRDRAPVAGSVAGPVAGRRRALAMVEDDRPSDFLNVAPLPGEASQPDYAESPSEEPLDLGNEYHVDETAQQHFESHSDDVQPADGFENTPVEFTQSEPEPRGEAAEPLPFSPPSLGRQADPEDAFEAPAATPAVSFSPEGPRPFDTPANPPEPFVADDDKTSENPVSDKQIFNADASTEDGANTDIVSDIAPAELPSLANDTEDRESDGESEGLVQLVQKLGNTLEKHREWSAQRAVAAPVVPQMEPVSPAVEEAVSPDIAEEFDPAAADDAAQAMAAYFGGSADDSASAPDEADEPRPFEAPESPAVTSAQTAAQPNVNFAMTQPSVQSATEDGDVEHPSKPAPVAGQAYAPFAGMGRLTVVDDEDSASDDDLNDLAATLSLPIAEKSARVEAPSPRPAFDIPPSGAAQTHMANDDVAAPAPAAEPERDASYSSLAALNNPFKSNAEEFVRVEEPEENDAEAQPAVLFPSQQQVRQPAADDEATQDAPLAGESRAFDRPASQAEPAPAATHGPTSNEDNERALRDALMNLQRMAK